MLEKELLLKRTHHGSTMEKGKWEDHRLNAGIMINTYRSTQYVSDMRMPPEMLKIAWKVQSAQAHPSWWMVEEVLVSAEKMDGR